LRPIIRGGGAFTALNFRTDLMSNEPPKDRPGAFSPPAAVLRLAAPLIFLILTTVATGCRAETKGSESSSILRIGFGLGASARVGGLSVLTEMLYAEPLIALDATGRPVGRLAERWGWEDGYRTLRVGLRSGIKLHDGRTLDARSARDFLQAKIDELKNSQHRGAFDNVVAIETPDDATMLLHLREPDAFLISEFNNAYLVPPGSSYIGTGPFRLLSREPVRAERFDQYHRGAPAIPNVVIQTYDSQRAAWAALMRGEVDAVQEVNRESADFLAKSTDVQTYTSLRPYYWALSFNLNHRDLHKAQVRRALNQAVNRDEIITSAMRGFAKPAVDPVWPLYWAYPQSEEPARFDPDSARTELDTAGLPARNGRRLRFRCLFYEDPQFERIALLLQRQLNEVGVELDLVPAPLDQLQVKLAAGDFDSVLLLFHSGRALDWTYRFWRSPQPGQRALQANGYRGADDVLDSLRRAFTEEEVRSGVTEVRRRFSEDPPAVFIAWQQITRAVSSRFDLSDADKQDAFANIWQWKPAAGRQ
jgi:peptide/nickel transport system substrate-binding protein